MYESKNGYWDDEFKDKKTEEVEEEVEEFAKHIDTYIFPDKEKINNILIYYNKKINGSFVKYLKTQCTEFLDMFAEYKKKIQSERYTATNIYVYPDIKTFNACLGNTTVKIERDILMGLRPSSIQSAYIVSDSDGDIHVVLPRSRGSDIYDTYFAEIMGLILANYEDKYANNVLGAKKKVVEYIKKREMEKLRKEIEKQEEEEKQQEEAERERMEKEAEEEAERERMEKEAEEEAERERMEKEMEEEAERERTEKEMEEEAERERTEKEMEEEAERERTEKEAEEEAERERTEQELQMELEEEDKEEKRLEILEPEESEEDIKLNEDMQFLEKLTKEREDIDSSKFEKFMQAFMLFRAAKFHNPEYMQLYADYCKTHKLLTLGKIDKANIKNWIDQCTLALQVEYTINLYGHQKFLKYCFAACDKNCKIDDLYKTIFGEEKLHFENALKEYCKLATRNVVPTLKLANEIEEHIDTIEKEMVEESKSGDEVVKETVISEDKVQDTTITNSLDEKVVQEESIKKENIVNENVDIPNMDISLKPLNAKEIEPIWMTFFNLNENGYAIPESHEYDWFINPEQYQKTI